MKLAPVVALLAFAVVEAPALAAQGSPETTAQAGAAAAEARVTVLRVSYRDRADLVDLIGRVDVATVNVSERYAVVLVEASEQVALQAALRAEGRRVDVDEAETASLAAALPTCYRTVAKVGTDLAQWAATYPALTQLTDIGDSWDKTVPGGDPGADLWMMRLTNEALPGPKPRFFLMANIHGREVASAESAMDFVNYLLTGYNRNADVTWLLNNREIYVVPMVNPDGHKKAEGGASWRKNTNNTNGCTNASQWGTDLNRNYDTNFAGPGSSGQPCSSTYHGASAEAEPETQAIADTLRALFPNPLDPSGVMITLHSFANYVVWPWGNGYNTQQGLLPKDKPGLEALGHKFGSINGYLSIMGDDWYPAAGATEDWSYEELDLAGYTFEIGNTFTPSCTTLPTLIAQNRPAYVYAAKVAPDPYELTRGPDVTSAKATPRQPTSGSPVQITAMVDDSQTGWVADPGFPQVNPDRNVPVASATAYLDTPPWAGGTPLAMAASDGAFDEPKETVSVTINTGGLALGKHVVYIQGRDADGHLGVVTAVDFTIR
jgi:hypothetical protein